MIVPHGVTVVNPGESESDTVVYTGSDNASNQAAIAWLLGEVWPLVASVRPHSKLRLVGHICNVIQKTPLVAAPNVELVGYVDRPIDELAKATIVVAPYLYGSGLKIKVIEAAAAGRAIVTTTSGAEGTGFEHETHVLIENDAASFARSVIRLLDDPALRTRLAAAAQEHVKSDYSYDVCYGALFDLLRQQATDDSRKIASAHKIASASVVIPPSVKIRIHTVIEALNSPQIVVWGNGSHTRALIPVLEQLGASIRCIVDNTVSVEDVSPENYPIIPGCTFIPTPNDMLILSSQTYERRMWNDLVNLRIAGTPVLSLYCLDFTSETIRCLLKGKDNNLFPLKQTVDKYYTNSFSYIVDNPIVSEYIIQSISSIVVQKGDCVIDVGANHGIHTIPLSNIVGENGLVIACEAVPENIADIWLKLNGDDLLSGIRCPIQTGNVKFYQAAVTKQEVMENKKETCFHYIHGADGYSGIKKRPDIKDEYEDMLITVPALTLDWIIEDNDLEGRNLSFIKIDVEGGDFDVLLGARNILKKYRPIIVFENGRQFSANLYNYTKEDFFEYFTSLEYDLFQFTGNKFSRGEWEKEDVFWESWCIHAQSDWHDWFENNLTNFIDIFIKNYR
jgi:FkbM family methyltransferase